MNKYIFILFSFVLLSYGIAIGKYELFPYQFIKMLKNTIAQPEHKNPNWSDTVRLFEYFSPKADVAFVGDSITRAGRWSEFFPSLKVINRGIASDRASDIALRINSVLSAQPSKIFIMVGINDIQTNVTVPKILENYELIINTLMKENIEVVIQSTIQCEVSICGVKVVESVNELNKGLKQLALKSGAKFLSLGDLSDRRGLNLKYTFDGFHLTAEGYIYWVEKIEPLVN